MPEKNSADEFQIPLYPKQELPPLKKLSAKGRKAHRMLKRYSFIAGGFGLISSPTLHQVSTAALLTKLLHDMSQIYGVSFSDNQSKILIAAILGGTHAHWINRYLARFIRHATPLRSAGLWLSPVITGSVIYYVGKLFLIHFETGVWKHHKK